MKPSDNYQDAEPGRVFHTRHAATGWSSLSGPPRGVRKARRLREAELGLTIAVTSDDPEYPRHAWILGLFRDGTLAWVRAADVHVMVMGRSHGRN